MNKSAVNQIARFLWVVPVALLLLALNQFKVSYDLRDTLNNGTPAVAEVIDVEVNERVDIPFGYVSLKVDLENGQQLVQEKMALPYTLLPEVRYETELDVLVYPDQAQQIVIKKIASTQWKMAGIQGMMAFVAFLMAGFGVFAWNRLLKKKGDPALRETF